MIFEQQCGVQQDFMIYILLFIKCQKMLKRYSFGNEVTCSVNIMSLLVILSTDVNVISQNTECIQNVIRTLLNVKKNYQIFDLLINSPLS